MSIQSVSRSNTRFATTTRKSSIKAKAAPRQKARARTAKNRTAKAKPKARKIPGGRAELKKDLKAALKGQHNDLAIDLLEWIFEVSVNYAHGWESKDPRQTVEDAFGIVIHELLPQMAKEYHSRMAVADMYASNFGVYIYGAKRMFE